MIKFISKDIWPTITKLSVKSKITQIAVAYFGSRSDQLLTLKSDDILIVSLDLNTVKLGQVDPYAIEKLYKLGVKIFTVKNLHTKIFIFDDKVITGSSNVSLNSRDYLVEAGILTNDSVTVKNAKEFIKSLASEPVDQAFIDLCKKHYKPFVFVRYKEKRKIQLSNTWVVSTHQKDTSEADQKILDKEQPKFEAKLKNKKEYSVINIEYRINHNIIKQIKEGDVIIEIFNLGKTAYVYSPQRVLGITKNPQTRKAFVRMECPLKENEKSWTKFESILKRNGIKYIKKTSTRNIINEEVKALLFDFFK